MADVDNKRGSLQVVTLIALIISNLTTLALGALLARQVGWDLGLVSFQEELKSVTHTTASAQTGPVWSGVRSRTVFDATLDEYPPISFGLLEKSLAINPLNTDIMYVASLGGGVLKTTDGGATWLTKNIGLPHSFVSLVRIHPGNPNRIYAGMSFNSGVGGQIYISDNGGDYWRPTVIGDGWGVNQNMNICALSAAIEFDPTDSAIAYHGTVVNACRNMCGGIYKTTDSFVSYEPNASCVSVPGADTFHDNDATQISVNPLDPSIIHVTSGLHAENGAMETSYDAGQNFYFEHVVDFNNSFLPVTDWGYKSLWALSSAVAPSNPDILYADYGYQALRINPEDRVVPLQGSAYGWGTNYALNELEYRRALVRNDGTRGSSASDGVGDNDEDGRNSPDLLWRPILDLRSAVPNATMPTSPSDSVPRNVRQIIVHPNDSNLFFAMIDAVPSVGSGTLWTILAVRPSNPADLSQEWSSKVILQSTNQYAPYSKLWFDPINPNRLWMIELNETSPRQESRLVRFDTTDNWNTWTVVRTAIPDFHYWGNGLLAADTSAGERIFSATSRDIIYSSNGGKNWSRSKHVSTEPVAGVTITETTPDTLFAYHSRRGYWYGSGGSAFGVPWFDIAYAISQMNTNVINQITSDQTALHALWFATDNGLYRHPGVQIASNDIVNSPLIYLVADENTPGLTDDYLWTVVVDETDPTTLLVGTRTGGIYRSTDSGASWTNVRGGVSDVKNILLTSPVSFAATGNGVLKSSDRGATWQSTGLATRTFSVSIDETDSNTIYAGTVQGVHRSRDEGATWEALPVATQAPVSAVLHATYKDQPALIVSGNGKGIERYDSGIAITRGAGAGVVNLFYSIPPSAQPEGYRIHYGITPAFGGTGATEGNSPVAITGVLDSAITGLDPNITYYFAVQEVRGGVPQSIGLTHKVVLNDFTSANCLNTPSDPFFDDDGDGVTICQKDCDDRNPAVVAGCVAPPAVPLPNTYVGVFNITENSATVRWRTGPGATNATDAVIEYGLDTAYGQTYTDPTLETLHNENLINPLDGLVPGTTYNFRYRSTAADGRTTGFSQNYTFTTLPPGCAENWTCTEWEPCSGGSQSRTCTDTASCGTSYFMPPLLQACGEPPPQPPPLPSPAATAGYAGGVILAFIVSVPIIRKISRR